MDKIASVKKSSQPCQHSAAAECVPRFEKYRYYYETNLPSLSSRRKMTMLRSKKDVDRHVRDLLNKTKTEDEVRERGRGSECWTLWRLYFCLLFEYFTHFVPFSSPFLLF